MKKIGSLASIAITSLLLHMPALAQSPPPLATPTSKAAPISSPGDLSAGLNLDTPELEAKKDTGASLGPLSNLNIGGALDMRLYLPKPGGATDQHIGIGEFDIHVAELFLTTNVGDHISVLAEQLLITSKMEDTVGQDHGFVYAIFSTIPGLPENLSLKVGRTRFRFGIDARSDSAANVLRTPVYKTLGTITDKGIEVSGYVGSTEWSLGVMNGVDSILVPVTADNGDSVEVLMDQRNGSKPIVARISTELGDSLGLGLSGFTGKTYPVYSHYGFAMHDMIFNGHTDDTQFIYKNRGAIDAKLRLGPKFDLSAEYAFGNDREHSKSYQVWSGYGRLDYRILPGKLSAQLQYDYFDDGRGIAIVDGMPYKDSGTIGLGLTYFLTDQSWLRAAWLQDDRGLFRSRDGNSKAPEYLGMIQTLVTY